MIRKQGFTLIELLVVIAIISILAAIVTPRVQGYILKARMTNTVSEIEGFETAITKMVTDAGKSSPRQLFENPPAVPVDTSTIPATVNYATLNNQIDNYSIAFYELLRQGRSADLTASGLTLAPGVREKLSTSYVTADLDGWNRQYRFWVGPWGAHGAIPFRCYRAGGTDNNDVYHPWIYSNDTESVDENGDVVSSVDREAEMDALLPGNPDADDLNGYPAARDLGIYIFSVGVNGIPDQPFDGTQTDDTYLGGGDDINNWDNDQGWSGFYS